MQFWKKEGKERSRNWRSASWMCFVKWLFFSQRAVILFFFFYETRESQCVTCATPLDQWCFEGLFFYPFFVCFSVALVLFKNASGLLVFSLNSPHPPFFFCFFERAAQRSFFFSFKKRAVRSLRRANGINRWDSPHTHSRKQVGDTNKLFSPYLHK